MKIAKALKLKNRLAGEIARLKAIVQANNSHEKGQEETYDVRKTFADMNDRVRELVSVKTAIACANAGMLVDKSDKLKATAYWAIFSMAELKGLIETMKATATKSGTFNEDRGFAMHQNRVAIEYVATFKQADVDGMIAAWQSEIDRLQDALDVQNATCDIVAIDGISV